MSDEHHVEWTWAEREVIAALPREDAVPAIEADDIARALRASGHLGRRSRWTVPLQIAAAFVLFIAGMLVGQWTSTRNSLEGELTRTNLSTGDRVLLLQRAGSAYVRAAQNYADASSKTDSIAVQVASQVLVGAASAVARNKLDDGFATELRTMLAAQEKPKAKVSNVIWY